MMRKILRLNFYGNTQGFPLEDIKVFLNSKRLERGIPTVIDWNENNSLEVKVGNEKSEPVEVTSLPIQRNIEIDTLETEIYIEEFQIS